MGERELPEGWEWKSLGDCCQTIRGIAFPSNSKIEHFQDGFVACLRTANVQAEVEVDDLWFIPEQFVKNEQQMVKKFDILISSANSLNLVGKVALVKKLEHKTTLGAFISLLRSNSTTDPKYLYYYLSSKEFKRFIPFIASTTTNISNISMTKLAEFRMAVPPLPVQRQIVAVLEKTELVNSQRKEADALTGALLQSVFLEMFGDPARNEKEWKKAKISDITVFHKQGLYTEVNYADDGIRLIRITDIKDNGNLDYFSMPFLAISEKIFEQFKVEIGDFLFARSGVSIGRCAIVESEIPCVFGSFIIKFQFDQKQIDNKFFLYYTRMPFVQSLLKRYTHGSANPNINADNIKDLEIYIPPLVLQQQFTRIVAEIEHIREMQVDSRREINSLFEGLMAGAFSVELVTNEA